MDGLLELLILAVLALLFGGSADVMDDERAVEAEQHHNQDAASPGEDVPDMAAASLQLHDSGSYCHADEWE